MPETSLTVLPPDEPAAETEYPLLRASARDTLLEVFHDNLGAAGLSSLDLPRIKVPSGGALSWTVSTPNGEETMKEVTGIALAWRPARLYWKRAFGEGGGRRPPDCTSGDGFTGVGDPGGDCLRCPYAQFGSAAKGQGQACKQIRQILLVRPGEILPHLISVPPTSLKPCRDYFHMLLGHQISYWAVTSRLRLEKATNPDGIAYARMQFLQGRVLHERERAALRPFHEQMMQMLAPIAIDVSDYTVEEEPSRDDAPRDEEVPPAGRRQR